MVTEKKLKRKINYKELNSNKKFCNEEVITEVAEELNVPQSLVRLIEQSQSKYTKQTIKAGGLESIIYVYLGRFKVNPRQIQKMMVNGMRI